NDEAAMPALIGADLQELGFRHAVEPGPVEATIGMMNLAGEGRHQRDLVCLAEGERADAGGQFGVIGHEPSRDWRSRGFSTPGPSEDICARKKGGGGFTAPASTSRRRCAAPPSPASPADQ